MIIKWIKVVQKYLHIFHVQLKYFNLNMIKVYQKIEISKKEKQKNKLNKDLLETRSFKSFDCLHLA